ncbi:MAG: ROK family protein [Bacteroidetes bacterium]|nr:ROK family protein [Bacteroidota bacterium]MBP6315729.1 ROK family protein [Chitinophagaceae bacterium]
MTQALRLGIDIGGTNTAYGLVNESGVIVAQGSISSRGHESPEAFVRALYQQMKEALPSSSFENITSIGVGAPNGNYYTGNIEFAPNLEWKGIIPLASLLQTQFSIPVRVSNDANAAAMGEMMYGVAKGMRDFIMVTLGTGVGSGFVANGELIYGHDGFAGELGHVIAVRDGRLCGCGRKGCLEAYTSATGIVATANEMIHANTSPSILANVAITDSKQLFEAAQKGDALAISIFDYTGKILGQTLADAVAITSPEAIILFGGLARAGHFILDPIKFYFEENVLIIYKSKVKILTSQLAESDAAILGAAAL